MVWKTKLLAQFNLCDLEITSEEDDKGERVGSDDTRENIDDLGEGTNSAGEGADGTREEN